VSLSDKYPLPLSISTLLTKKCAQNQLSHMGGTGETSLGLSCVINGSGNPNAKMQVSVRYISYKKLILGTGTFMGCMPKKWTPQSSCLALKLLHLSGFMKSECIIPCWSMECQIKYMLLSSKLTMSDTKLLKHGVL
jgi:hypothetical protein